MRGLNIWGDPAIPNNDGMDIDSSSNVLVQRTNASALDDAICIKTDDGELLCSAEEVSRTCSMCCCAASKRSVRAVVRCRDSRQENASTR